MNSTDILPPPQPSPWYVARRHSGVMVDRPTVLNEYTCTICTAMDSNSVVSILLHPPSVSMGMCGDGLVVGRQVGRQGM